jgi:ribonuclease D
MEERYVSAPKDLAGLCNELRGRSWLALDTEFLRERTYYAQLCLIQVATDDIVACVDPLLLADISPLLDVIYDTHTIKVIHSASQDLEILCNLRGEPPSPVFDTQIAAMLLGFGNQISYAAMVQSLLGAELDKAHTRTDWSRRPLSQAQINYALDDVRYLADLYRQTQQRLRDLNRLDWLAEDFAALSDPNRYTNPPQEAWRRLRGISRLHGAQRATLRALAAWREAEAQRTDKPRQWVIKDESLLALARQQPRRAGDLEKVPGLDEQRRRNNADAILACVRSARAEPRSAWPQDEDAPRLSEEQDAIVDALMAIVRERGAANQVSPGMLATRKELARLAGGDATVPVMHGWRRELVGDDLRRFLDGHAALHVRGGRIGLDADRP